MVYEGFELVGLKTKAWERCRCRITRIRFLLTENRSLPLPETINLPHGRFLRLFVQAGADRTFVYGYVRSDLWSRQERAK